MTADSQQRSKSPNRVSRHPRRRAMLWITIGCLLFGLLELGAPAEQMLQKLRDLARHHPASGHVVVIGIDNRTLDSLKQWPLQRRYHAAMIERLNALGVRRIFFSLIFSTRSNDVDDRLLARAIAHSRAEVVLPATFSMNPMTHERSDSLPIDLFRQHATLGNTNARFDYDGAARRLPYAMTIKGTAYPSFATRIAQQVPGRADSFPIDYSIDVSTVPVISANDLLQGRVPARAIRGRDVVIGTTTLELAETYTVPSVGRVPGVLLHVMGGETLLAGTPVELPWFLPFVVAWLASVALLFCRNRLAAFAAYATVLAVTLCSPVYLNASHVYVDTVPSLMVLAATGIWALWFRYRNRYRQRATVNVVSGLPNLNALRAVASQPGIALVAARVRNFAEIAASLAPDMERVLVEQIARRLALGSGGATVYQGDDGIFAWLMPSDTVSFTSDQFDALSALFRNAVALGDRHVDLAITFGMAADATLLPFNRLGGALLAADEAAEAGLHWKLHEPVRPGDANWKLSLLSSLDAAIDAGEIWVAYQPKIDLAADRVAGAEALVRWTHPQKGPISPADFIPAAEQHNRIAKLTYHVLETAIRAAASINSHGIDFGIAVNLSTRLLHDEALVDRVAALLARYRLPAEHLTLEITETAAMTDSHKLIGALDALRAIGIGLSIDDYGTGFSNLENLRTIPATEIKIDRSFVDAIDRSRSDTVMVRSTIHMAHSLGQTVVAEGVERAETLRTLRAMGCDQVQGYLTGRPMRFTALSRTLIIDHRRHAA